MSSKIAKRLRLSTETVQTLSSHALDNVVGGYRPPPTQDTSVIDACPSRPQIGCVSRTCPA